MTDGLRLVLARHGSTPWTYPVRRFQGRIDVPLSARGTLEAMRLAEALCGLGIVSVWHSPLTRAQETAEIVARHLTVPLRSDDRLVEMSFGSWEGRSHAAVEAESPGALAHRSRDVFQGTPPDGEPVGLVLRRVMEVIADLRGRGDAPRAVVAHEGVIRAWAVCLGVIPVENFYNLAIPCGGALEVRHRSDGGYEMTEIALPGAVVMAAEDGDTAASNVACDVTPWCVPCSVPWS